VDHWRWGLLGLETQRNILQHSKFVGEIRSGNGDYSATGNLSDTRLFNEALGLLPGIQNSIRLNVPYHL